MDEMIANAEIEVEHGIMTLHFNVRNADDPLTAAHELDAFEGAKVRVNKDVTTGSWTLTVWGDDAPPMIFS